MTIKVNDERRYTGAASVLVPPVTSADCTLFPSFEQLVKAEQVAGRGATIRHGVAFAKRTTAELEAACTPPAPEIQSVAPATWEWTQPADVYGINFGAAPGECHLGDAITWAGSTKKLLQPVSTWTPTAVHVTAVNVDVGDRWWYVYVLNQAGYRNVVGFKVWVGQVP